MRPSTTWFENDEEGPVRFQLASTRLANPEIFREGVSDRGTASEPRRLEVAKIALRVAPMNHHVPESYECRFIVPEPLHCSVK